MLIRIALLLGLAFGGWQSALAGVVRIADGDCASLVNALNAASQGGGPSTILLTRGGVYSACSLNFLASNSSTAMTIDAQGAELQLPTIAASGSFTLRNASIRPAGDGSARLLDCGTSPSWAAIACVSGNVTFDSVSIDGLDIPSSHIRDNGLAEQVAVIVSHGSGSLILRNVTISNLSMTFGSSQVQSTAYPAGIVSLASAGDLEIYNSTFTNLRLGAPPATLVSTIVLSFADASHLPKIANSLFASNLLSDCNWMVQSLGGNVAGAADCGFSAANGDKVVADASLGSMGDHGGLIPTQAINGDSPARGAGVAQYCEAVDARGYTRAPQGCDAGAYEFGGGSGSLTANGLNGFYYDPDANGHYVSMQRIHDNGDIAIVWSTFDSNGNQAWIYGLGQLTDRHIHAIMSQNLGGVLQPGGAPTGATVRPWGTVDIDLTSCLRAQFSYQSSLVGFGSGQFPLTRLALVSDFGCSD